MDARVKPAHDTASGARACAYLKPGRQLLQITAETLDAAAGLFQVLGLGRV
jgi:hypothetical protein